MAPRRENAIVSGRRLPATRVDSLAVFGGALHQYRVLRRKDARERSKTVFARRALWFELLDECLHPSKPIRRQAAELVYQGLEIGDGHNGRIRERRSPGNPPR